MKINDSEDVKLHLVFCIYLIMNIFRRIISRYRMCPYLSVSSLRTVSNKMVTRITKYPSISLKKILSALLLETKVIRVGEMIK